MSQRRRTLPRFPPGWRDELDPATVYTVLVVERYSSEGKFILRGPDAKGYYWVRLCVGHPYASRTGWARLHRYLMERKLGRKLASYEHVHHEDGAAKDTTDITKLAVYEERDHGRHHANGCYRCGPETLLWKPRDRQGRFVRVPDELRSATSR